MYSAVGILYPTSHMRSSPPPNSESYSPRPYNHGSKSMIAAADEGKTSLAME